jgi:hypothetical protein
MLKALIDAGLSENGRFAWLEERAMVRFPARFLGERDSIWEALTAIVRLSAASLIRALRERKSYDIIRTS